MNNLYIGIMSGTSLDGIDVALCKIDSTSCKLISAKEYPFDALLKKDILELIDGYSSLKKIGEMNIRLGLAFAHAVNRFMREKELKIADVNAVGLHGQTLWHSPNGEFPFSMQLGDPSMVVAKTGLRVVADFRSMDVANGGQGAPFAPAFHQFLFADLKEKTAVLNIGGMANITLLSEELQGWDTGCGNVLLDYWIMQTRQKSYDEDGEFAKSGVVNSDLLNSMLDDDYFKILPPKSTGREYFNATWLASHFPVFQTLNDEDIQRTLLELTAFSIAKDVKKSGVELLIVCGGGAQNKFLMQRIKALTKIDIKVSDELGVSSDALEAMAFAWLAYKRVNNEEVNLKSVTGASKNSLLGGIYG